VINIIQYYLQDTRALTSRKPTHYWKKNNQHLMVTSSDSPTALSLNSGTHLAEVDLDQAQINYPSRRLTQSVISIDNHDSFDSVPSSTLLALRAAELATGSSRNSQAGVDIGEETSRVLLDLLDVEAIARVGAVGDNTSLEWAPQAANAAATSFGNLDRVGEGNAIQKTCCQ
jgi:hypothetical protein